jgi:hypothetical protein
MTWLLIGVLIWVTLAVPVALLIGRGIRLADAKRVAPSSDPLEADFADSLEADLADSEVPPVEPDEMPWTGPSTVPFAPSRLPWGGDRTSVPRPRPPVIRAPIRPSERDPNTRNPEAT